MNVQLQDQIHDYFAYVDEEQGSVDLAAIGPGGGVAPVDPVHRVPDRPARYRSRWLVAAAAFVAVLAALGMPMLLTADDEPPVVDSVPSTTTTTVAQNRLELSGTLAGTPPTWLRLHYGGGVVSTPTGLLGIDPASADSLVRSVGGGEWQREPLPGSARRPAKLHTVGNAYLLATGDGRVFSTVDGMTWAEENADEFPDLTSTVRYLGFDIESLKALDVPWVGSDIVSSYVIKLNGRVLAFENGDKVKGVARAFTSPDGVVWAALEVPVLDDLDVINSEAFAVRDGVLVISGRNDSSGRNRTTLLRTTDGFSWTNVTPEDERFDPQGIVAADSGWIAGGNLPGQFYSSRVYFSDDGLTWTEIEFINDPFATADHVHVFVAGDTLMRYNEGFPGQYQFASLEDLSSP